MNRRVVLVCLAVGIFVLGFAPALAKGACKMEAEVIICMLPEDPDSGREVGLLDKRCANEGRKCRGRSECETLYTDVACIRPGDGDPSVLTIGLGCFCGGGSPPVAMPRRDPVSVDEALRLIEAIESAEVEDPALCEAPPELTAK